MFPPFAQVLLPQSTGTIKGKKNVYEEKEQQRCCRTEQKGNSHMGFAMRRGS